MQEQPYQYVRDFLTKDEADALFNACGRLDFHIRQHPLSGHDIRHQAVCFTEKRSPRAEEAGDVFPLAEAPKEILDLASKLTAYLGNGRIVNYLSVVRYRDGKDHFNWHQHKEDKGHDTSVLIVTTGAERNFSVAEFGGLNSKTNKPLCKAGTERHFIAKHGSLIVLSSEANDTHLHAVLDEPGVTTPRYAINCKCIDSTYDGGTPPKQATPTVGTEGNGAMTSEIQNTNEAEIISAPAPEKMNDMALAMYIVGEVGEVFKKASRCVPYLRELRQRFARLHKEHMEALRCWTENRQGDKGPKPKRPQILGCQSWEQFVTKKLGLSDRYMRQLLQPKHDGPSEFLTALRLILKCSGVKKGRETPIIYFVPYEGCVAIRVTSAAGHTATQGFPKCPCPPELLNAPEFGRMTYKEELEEMLEKLPGDPSFLIFGAGELIGLDFRKADTELALNFSYRPDIMAANKQSEERRRAEEHALRSAAFREVLDRILPGVKRGDQLTFPRNEELEILTVENIGDTSLVLKPEKGATQRWEKEHLDRYPLRFTTDADRAHIEEQKFLAALDRAEQQGAKKAEREERERKDAEVEKLFHNAQAIVQGTKFRISGMSISGGWGGSRTYSNAGEGLVTVSADVTLEELAKIVVALPQVRGAQMLANSLRQVPDPKQ